MSIHSIKDNRGGAEQEPWGGKKKRTNKDLHACACAVLMRRREQRPEGRAKSGSLNLTWQFQTEL